MAFLKKKMVSFLTETALKGIRALDTDSPCAEALKKFDVEDILREDIDRICEAMSFGEMTKILSLAVKLKTPSQEGREIIKSDIKKIAEEIIARVESRSGKLKIPEPCRHLLLDL